MPVIEYSKDYERTNGTLIKKGTQQIVTWDHAKKLSQKDQAIIVGSESGRRVQDRTRGVNAMTDHVASSTPTKESTVEEIKDYLDEEEIPYSSDDLKADLLKHINKNN